MANMTGRILIADDNATNRKLLTVTLLKAGHKVIEACDGKEALERSVTHLPDLILLDIVMPELDGYQVCSSLKGDKRTADIPVIFLSAKSDVEDKIRGLEIGGADYITKPFNLGEVLARVETQLKLRALIKELIEKQARLDEDLKAAAAIQRSLLPRKKPALDNIEIAWKFTPCEMIGGDIFNAFRLDEVHMGFYMVDVSGHGAPSAMVTVSVSQMLQPHSGYLCKKRMDVAPFYEIVSPREVLEELDREYPIERFDKYFTIVYAILNAQTGQLRYSNAAHPFPVLMHSDGTMELLDKGGTIIGLGGMVPFEEGTIELQGGDKLFFYTDGLTEYQNAEGISYGEDRLIDLLVSLKDEPVGEILDRAQASLMDFGRGGKLQDDVSLVGIEYGEWRKGSE